MLIHSSLLAQACCHDIGKVILFSPEDLAMEELPQESNLFRDDDEVNNYDHYCLWEAWEENMIRYDPTERGFSELFVFTSYYFTKYFDAVSTDLVRPRLDDIEELCRPGTTRFRNWSTQNCRLDCVLNAKFDFDNAHDALTVTAVYGLECSGGASLAAVFGPTSTSSDSRPDPGISPWRDRGSALKADR